MNACIRALVRTSIFHGLEPYGIYRGYQGMIESDIQPMDSKSCLLYTSDAADERSSVDLGGRRIIKKKKKREVDSAN